MSFQDRWIIVGGGASGLGAAYFLRQLGIASVILEREDAAGGRMGTLQLGERTLDCGGKNIGRRYTLFRRFAASLGSHPFEYFGLNSSQEIDGRVRTFEAASRWQSMAALMRGVRPGDIVRFGRVLWQVRTDESSGYLGSALSRRLGDRYDHLPASRYFSPAFCDRVIRPMSVRMNGAEPDEIYLGNLPSNVRMLLDTYEQFANGLAPVLREAAAQYDVRPGMTVEGLLTKYGRVSGVRVRRTDGTSADVHGAGVILATPAGAAASLLGPVAPGAAAALRSVTYHPVTIVMAEYDRPIFPAATRAFVFGPREAVSNAGAYGINERHLVRYTFSGRAARQLLAQAPDAETLLAIAEAALGRYVRVEPAFRRRFVARHFDPGLCAYTARHAGAIDRLQQQLGSVAGVYATGDYMQGASLEACFRAAAACVGQLARREPLTLLKSA